MESSVLELKRPTFVMVLKFQDTLERFCFFFSPPIEVYSQFKTHIFHVSISRQQHCRSFSLV